jgi:hypothetical protein
MKLYLVHPDGHVTESVWDMGFPYPARLRVPVWTGKWRLHSNPAWGGCYVFGALDFDLISIHDDYVVYSADSAGGEA